MLKYEFDNVEELEEAERNLDNYHDCEYCHGKIVCIKTNGLGTTFCGYCGAVVKYPRLTREAAERWLKEKR